VHDRDSTDHAAHLARRIALAEGVHAMTVRPVLHGDNGATLKGTTVLAMLYWLGIEPSYSRPRVSDDNPYAEAVFRTGKYRPEFPVKGFVELDAARTWAARLVDWYYNEHRHSGIKYVTPAQRHAHQGRPLRTARHELYRRARHSNPRRWSRQTCDWTPVAAVMLNPERDTVIQAGSPGTRRSGSTTAPAFPYRPDRPLAAARKHRRSEQRSHLEPHGPPTPARGWRAPHRPRSEHCGMLWISRSTTLSPGIRRNRSCWIDTGRCKMRAATCLTFTASNWGIVGGETHEQNRWGDTGKSDKNQLFVHGFDSIYFGRCFRSIREATRAECFGLPLL